MSNQWLYRAFGQEFGPLSFAELQELASSGTISADSEVRSADSGRWELASAIDGLGIAPLSAMAGSHTPGGSDPKVAIPKGDDWYYNIGGLEMGPVMFDGLLELAKAEQLAADDQVKLGIDGKWRRAGSIGRVMAVLPFQAAKAKVAIPAPPIPVSVVSQTRRTPPNGIAIPREESKPASTVQPAAKTQVVMEKPATPRRTTPAAEFPVQQPPATVSTVQKPAVNIEVDILARVRESLDSRNIPGFSRLELFNNGRVVIVRGSLASEGERLLAIRAVQQTQGVIRVDDMLTVTGVQMPRPIAQTPPRSALARVTSRKKRSDGPGMFATLLENIKGEYRNQAIAGVVAATLLGFWFYPRGPVRPVAVHPVKGRVVLDGQPLANAAIVLHRVGNSKLPANLHPRGKAMEDGSFMLETFDPKDGAPDGDFVATVFLVEETEVDGERQTGPNILPAVYSKPETSPLKLKITSSTKELAPLELTKG